MNIYVVKFLNNMVICIIMYMYYKWRCFEMVLFILLCIVMKDRIKIKIFN